MKKLGFYAVVVAVLVFTLWFCTKEGMQPDKGASPPVDTVGSVLLESRSMGKKVRVESEEDIQRLSETLSTLSEENGMMVDLEEDFPEHMRDWTIQWLSTNGESQAAVEISAAGTVFRGDQCFNFLGGEIFDMDYLRGLLLGLPEVREPQEIIDVEGIERASMEGGGREPSTFTKSDLEELKAILRTASFCEDGEQANCGTYGIRLYSKNRYEESKTITLCGNLIEFGDYIFKVEGEGFSDEWIEYMFRPRICHEEDILFFSISTEDKSVRITNPELMERLEGDIREMNFKEDGPGESEQERFYINRYYADDHYDYAIFIIDEETIRYGSRIYKVAGDKKFDLDLYSELIDPEGPYKNHPGVEYWKDGDPPMPEITPRPQPTAGAELEPEGTPPFEVMDDPPEEKVFDFDEGYVIMDYRTIFRDEDFEALADELRNLHFVRRDKCDMDSFANHATGSDLTPYHGDPYNELTWYDKDGHVREEFRLRTMEGWITYGGYYYEAKEGGIDLENIRRLENTLPGPEWYESSPIKRLRGDITKAKSLWIKDQDYTWAVVVNDAEILERISNNLKDKEFFAQPGEYPMDDPYTYELEWYENVLGPYGSSGCITSMMVKDRYSVRGGYKLREGEIDMALLDELCKRDGEYSGREGVRFVWMKDIAPEDNANAT